jgi:hypothetical protein
MKDILRGAKQLAAEAGCAPITILRAIDGPLAPLVRAGIIWRNSSKKGSPWLMRRADAHMLRQSRDQLQPAE